MVIKFTVDVPEDGVECEYFAVSSINFSLVYKNKYCVQVYLDNCAYKL